MNKLFRVENGASYWVVAPTAEHAEGQVRALPDFDDDDPEFLTIELGPGERTGTYLGQNGETCSIELAFELCQEFPQIIAGSEWP